MFRIRILGEYWVWEQGGKAGSLLWRAAAPPTISLQPTISVDEILSAFGGLRMFFLERPSMTRLYISQFGQKETINEVFVAGGKQLRPNRTGNLYLQVELSDRTGTISARMWNANEVLYRSFEDGDYVRVEGTTQIFQGAVQMIVKHLHKVDPSEVNPDDFTPQPAKEAEKLVARLSEMLRGMKDPGLRNLGECFLLDEAFMSKLMMAPAGTKHHHAYHGGLLSHVVGLMEVVLRLTPCYPQIDGDLLLMGAFLH